MSNWNSFTIEIDLKIFTGMSWYMVGIVDWVIWVGIFLTWFFFVLAVNL